MIARNIQSELMDFLDDFPVVAILGPRQVGKTTLAFSIQEQLEKPCLYLDLELDSDRAKLKEPELFLKRFENELVVLDEIQRIPELFPLLRSLVDLRRRKGERNAHFLVLGSASQDLLHQSSESLAGRIAFLPLTPFTIPEVTTDTGPDAKTIDSLWMRGGFPDSFLAKSESASLNWRKQFITTYLERDIPLIGPRLPHERVRRLWTMLGHDQGGLLNAARLASGLGVSGNTVRFYIDVLTDLYMIRQLSPWHGNVRKRLVKAPKVYVRDTGLLHALAGVKKLNDLFGHPLCGPSWEGFVIENIISVAGDDWAPSYYRTGAGAEIDLILEGPGAKRIAVEVKRSLSPSVQKGFQIACDDIKATNRYYVIPEGDAYQMNSTTQAIGLEAFIKQLYRKRYNFRTAVK